MMSADSLTTDVEFGSDTTVTITKPSKGSRFWLTFSAILLCTLLGALDLTALSTALPTITNDLHGGDNFVWVGAAYALASTAILPLSGSLADIFGRKPVILVAIVNFSIGSVLAGTSRNMNMMIAARTVQGLGGGTLIILSEIIVSDLVPLAERGVYQGIIGLSWAFASSIGPPIGGLLCEKASWRWLFYLNLPLTAISMVLVVCFLDVRTPEGSIREKMRDIDWMGNAIVIVGTTLAVTGLTFAGVRFPWSSVNVLAPLLIGLALMVAFVFYEAKVPKRPTLPIEILSNRTSLGGYMATLIHGMTSIAIIYFYPVYLQACVGKSPIGSGIGILPMALIISAFAIIGGVSVQALRKFVPTNAVGWALTLIGFGLLSLLKADDRQSKWIGYQVFAAAGTGMVYTATTFPILAPLHVSRTAAALSFFAFTRSLAQTWGITISSTILQNELRTNLPASFTSQFAAGAEIAYSAIPEINGLAEPLRHEVREAFADSMATIWKTMIGIAGLGFLTLFLLKEVPMAEYTDQSYGLTEANKSTATQSTRLLEQEDMEHVHRDMLLTG